MEKLEIALQTSSGPELGAGAIEPVGDISGGQEDTSEEMAEILQSV